uniref:Uncharacterized protein n=1 Tax=Rhizophora mucronata TaxID=61149 RepID=A0A2P2IWP4_RHIMU
MNLSCLTLVRRIGSITRYDAMSFQLLASQHNPYDLLSNSCSTLLFPKFRTLIAM